MEKELDNIILILHGRIPINEFITEYNITDLLYQNNNCIGVILGNGFYNPLPLRMWGNRNLRESLNVGNPKFICKIVIEYEDGHIDEIGSNES